MAKKKEMSWLWPALGILIVLCLVGTWIYNVSTGVTQ